MKPADLLDPASLPEDLQWLAAEHRLQPNDPVFLLLAWHWHRVQKSEDAIKLATLELKAAIDARFAPLVETADMISALRDQLAETHEALEQKPLGLAQRLEAELRTPVSAAVAEVLQLKKSLGPLVQSAQAAQRRQLLATLVVGIVLGATGCAWFLL